MIKVLLEKLLDGGNLTFEESEELISLLMKGDVSEVHMAAVLSALRTKGETEQEIAGFAKGMTEAAVKIDYNYNGLMDLCGTGGDKSGTFNISTAATFVVAAGGIKTAKHGNRSISSKSGSADVLEKLGISINMNHIQAKKALDEIGVCFIFAPNFHKAMKHVAPVRKAMGVRTIFNMLGPLTNPALTKYQVIGTFNNDVARKLASACSYLNKERVTFVCTENRYDEVLLTGSTLVVEYVKDEPLKEYKIDYSDFGYNRLYVNDLKGGTPEENAGILLDILSGKEKSPKFQVVAANAAMAFYNTGNFLNIREALNYAEEIILSGKALAKLNELKSFSESL